MTSVHPHDDVRIFRLEALPLARAGWQVVILNREFEGKKEGVFFRRVELPVRRLPLAGFPQVPAQGRQGFFHAEICQQPVYSLGCLLAIGILQGAGKPLQRLCYPAAQIVELFQ